jgi:ABC-type transporter Mla subunit MlaD
MKRIWKRKGVIALVIAAVVLALGATGAVALATGPGDEGRAGAPTLLVTATTDVGPALAPSGEWRERLRDRLERLQARVAELRAKMTPEDRAAFDRLLETAKEQRQVLREAREDLRDTLQQMRDLTGKYRGGTATTAPVSSQVQ